jgi:uncharacterized protein YuzE
MRTSSGRITYDPEANMAYVHVVEAEAGASKRQVVVHDDALPSTIVVDLDADGRILGFELFDGSRCLPLRLLDALR